LFDGNFVNGYRDDGNLYDRTKKLIFSGTFDVEGNPWSGYKPIYNRNGIPIDRYDFRESEIWNGSGQRVDNDGGITYTFEGEFKNGVLDGKGICIVNKIIIYKGEFKLNMPHGHGTAYNADGSQYVGQFEYGEYHGDGKESHPDGSWYEGQFKHGEYDGNGKFYLSDKEIKQSGYFEKNKLLNGYQHFYGSDDQIHTCRVKEGQYWQGYGPIDYTNGDHYFGNIEGGMANGEGKRQYTDGSWYRGEFKDDLPHGKGKFHYANGNCMYDGKIKHNRMDGQGILYDPDEKKIYKGTFKDGKRDGSGSEYRAAKNFVKYHGEFKNDMHHGFGVLFVDFIDGNNLELFLSVITIPTPGMKYQGHFINNKFEGNGMILDAKERILIEGNFKNGKLVKPVQFDRIENTNINSKKRKRDEDDDHDERPRKKLKQLKQ